MTAFDSTLCELGEGPLWHPLRKTLFWFDILGKRMFSRSADHSAQWQFDEHFSAAGWVDIETLILASETALWRFDIGSGEKEQICAFDADNQVTRSNDGRADPWGGFWIGTMGKDHEAQAGAIYRYYQGELRQLVRDVTVSNAICFAPDKGCAYYTDTVTQKIMRQPLAAQNGWPEGDATVFIDLSQSQLFPDGAVTDAQGNLWVAIWGAACVICFAPDGTECNRIDLPAKQTTCPAFGGPELRDLHVTSAAVGLSDAAKTEHPLSGATFVINGAGTGQPEPRVIL